VGKRVRYRLDGSKIVKVRFEPMFSTAWLLYFIVFCQVIWEWVLMHYVSVSFMNIILISCNQTIRNLDGIKRICRLFCCWTFWLLSSMNWLICLQIFLDPKERNNTEYKLETFTAVYRRLCGKDVVYEYPLAETNLSWDCLNVYAMG
jgi:hypothetical protein